MNLAANMKFSLETHHFFKLGYNFCYVFLKISCNCCKFEAKIVNCRVGGFATLCIFYFFFCCLPLDQNQQNTKLVFLSIHKFIYIIIIFFFIFSASTCFQLNQTKTKLFVFNVICMYVLYCCCYYCYYSTSISTYIDNICCCFSYKNKQKYE